MKSTSCLKALVRTIVSAFRSSAYFIIGYDDQQLHSTSNPIQLTQKTITANDGDLLFAHRARAPVNFHLVPARECSDRAPFIHHEVNGTGGAHQMPLWLFISLFKRRHFDARCAVIDRFGARRMCMAGVELLDLFGPAGLEAFRFDLLPDKHDVPFPIFTARGG